MKKVRLPNEIIPIKNKDKGFHEKWAKGRNKLNIIHPWRGVLLGPPNCGKGVVAKNLILRADPPFEEIMVIHPDGGYTKEWDDCVDRDSIINTIPSPDEFEGEVKTLVIIDDVDVSSLPKEQNSNLDRLFGYVSTHKNVSVCVLNQDPFSIPPIVRRCSNLWVLWKCPDLDSMAQVSRKSGMSSKSFNDIFGNLMDDVHDSLWIDMTEKSPYKLRKNGFTLIKKNEEKQIDMKSLREKLFSEIL